MSKEKEDITQDKEQDEVNASENNADTNKQESQEETTEKKEPTLEEKNKELNDKFLRLYAEFENFRKRTNKEKVDIISNANAGILKDILPVLDDFERAIANNENATDVESVKEGFNLIYNKLRTTLVGKGLKPMQTKGETFDSEIHEAVANIPAPKKKQKGKVMDEVEKGYYLNEKVIRFAKVVVGQ